MKTFLHVFNTWIVSIFIAAFISFVCELNSNEWFDPFLFPVFFYFLVAAIPSFFISRAFLALIQQAAYSNYEKLFLWFFTAIVSVVLNIFILLLVFVREIISTEIIFLFWPAYAAVVVTIVLRSKQFFSLVNKTTHHETNLV